MKKQLHSTRCHTTSENFQQENNWLLSCSERGNLRRIAPFSLIWDTYNPLPHKQLLQFILYYCVYYELLTQEVNSNYTVVLLEKDNVLITMPLLVFTSSAKEMKVTPIPFLGNHKLNRSIQHWSCQIFKELCTQKPVSNHKSINNHYFT